MQKVLVEDLYFFVQHHIIKPSNKYLHGFNSFTFKLKEGGGIGKFKLEESGPDLKGIHIIPLNANYSRGGSYEEN